MILCKLEYENATDEGNLPHSLIVGYPFQQYISHQDNCENLGSKSKRMQKLYNVGLKQIHLNHTRRKVLNIVWGGGGARESQTFRRV